MRFNNRYLAIAYVLATFLLGAVAGGAMGYEWGRQRWFRPPPPSGPMSHRIVQRLTAELGLSEDQQRQIEPLVMEGAAEMEKLHREATQRVRDAIKRGHERILPLLTEAQRAKLADLDAAREKSAALRWGNPAQEKSGSASREAPAHQ